MGYRPSDAGGVDAAVQALAEEIRRRREHAGLSHADLAITIQYSRDYVGRAERPRKGLPSAALVAALDDALNANGALINLHNQALVQRLTNRSAPRTEPLPKAGSSNTAGAPPPASARFSPPIQELTVSRSMITSLLHTGAPMTIDDGADRNREVDPVELLRGIAAVAVTSGLIVGDRWDSSRRLGRSDVARLNAVTALYRSLDYEFGGGILMADVGSFAESASALLDLSYSDDLAPSLHSSVAAARQLAGWTAFDGGSHSDAQRHFLSAERAAVAAGDRLMAARVRYCQARQYQHLWHNRDAFETLRLAQDHLGATATPAISALLHGAEAASLAALGSFDSALTSLDRARAAFDRIDIDNEPEWMHFYDQGEVLAQYGRVYRDFARNDQRYASAAVKWVTQAIAAFSRKNVRSGVLNEVGLCSALFLADEPEQAVAVGRQVLEDAGQLSSRRIIDRILNLRRDLARHKTRPEVVEFVQALTTSGSGVR